MRRFKSARFLLYPIVTVVLLFIGFLLYSGVKLGASTVSSWREEEEKTKTNNRSTVIYVPVPAEPAQHVPVPTFHPFGPDGCYETNLGYEARWSPKDKAMRVFDPGGGSHVERLGKKSPISAFGPGTWRFCKEDPDATGVVIWE